MLLCGWALRGAAAKSEVRFAAANYKRFLPYLPQAVGLEQEFGELVEKVKRESKWVAGNKELILGRGFEQRWMEVYHMVRREYFSPREAALLSFLAEYDLLTEQHEPAETEQLCLDFRAALVGRFGMQIKPRAWSEACRFIAEHPVEKMPRNYVYYVLSLVVSIVGVFATLALCIVRVICVLEKNDNEASLKTELARKETEENRRRSEGPETQQLLRPKETEEKERRRAERASLRDHYDHFAGGYDYRRVMRFV